MFVDLEVSSLDHYAYSTDIRLEATAFVGAISTLGSIYGREVGSGSGSIFRC